MEPIHRIAPRQPDIAAVPPVQRQPIGPEEREQKRREREQERRRRREQRDAQAAQPPAAGEDDGRPHIDLTA